jgi:hypothetical protein
MGSRVISEEFPNVITSRGFLNGLACNGPYCDNVLPYQFKSPNLKNTRECEWSLGSTQLPKQWLDCGNGRLISGIRCEAGYCGDVSIYCCQVESQGE